MMDLTRHPGPRFEQTIQKDPTTRQEEADMLQREDPVLCALLMGRDASATGPSRDLALQSMEDGHVT